MNKTLTILIALLTSLSVSVTFAEGPAIALTVGDGAVNPLG